MAITTVDGIIAGLQHPRAFHKSGITMAAAGGSRGYTPFYANGNPGAATAPSAGINGVAVSSGRTGTIPRTDPVSGNAYLNRFAATASLSGVVWLIDRLWENSGLSVTSTSLQSITPATLPARSIDGTTNGGGVMAAVEWSATGGAGTPTVTLTYTDQDGNTGNSATLTAVGSPPVGTFEIFQLAAGDTGIRAPTGFQQNATRTSGTMHLVLFRVLAQIEIANANVGGAVDALTGGLPRIYDGTAPQVVFFPSATTATVFFGTYQETQG